MNRIFWLCAKTGVAARHPIGDCNASWSGERHDESKRPQHQKETEVQELRGQGPAEEGRQGRKMPALRRNRIALARIPQKHALELDPRVDPDFTIRIGAGLTQMAPDVLAGFGKQRLHRFDPNDIKSRSKEIRTCPRILSLPY
jgi:hypothetical protein